MTMRPAEVAPDTAVTSKSKQFIFVYECSTIVNMEKFSLAVSC